MRRVIGPLLTVLCAAGLIALFVFGLASQGSDRSLDNAVAVGRLPSAPDSSRTLPLLGANGTRALAAWRGHVLVLNFWASWCDPCRAEAPLLERTQKQLAGSGGTVLGVTFRDTSSDSLAFVRQYRLTYPMLRDVDGKLAASYGTSELPETFVLDRHLRVVAISRGEVDRAFLARALAKAGQA